MAWKETSVLDNRMEFVVRALTQKEKFSVLCREFNISRTHGRKWVKRFLSEGESGLHNRSRRPKSNCKQPDADVILEIVSIRGKMNWGCGINLRPVLLKKFKEDRVPSASTIDRIIKKAGLVETRKRRRAKPSHRIQTRAVAQQPNDIWTMDFKGWWRTLDRRRCEPLTVRDDYTKYVLCLQGMRQIRWEAVKERLTDTFMTYGLPGTIRTDNGAPFAHPASLRGLTQLSAWLIAQGIGLDRIDPGRPDQNGAHERMHKDLKRQVQRDPAADLTLQQPILDQWKEHFNTVRPHTALDLKTPAALYKPSPRKFNAGLEIIYPHSFEVRKVSTAGHIRIQQKRFFLSHALAGWSIGIEESEQDNVRIWFAELYLGNTDKGFVRPISAD